MKRAASLCSVLAALAVACCLWLFLGPTILWNTEADIVLVANDGPKPIQDLTLTFSGGECNLTTIPEHSRRTLLANIRGESGLSIKFKDSSGLEHGDRLEIYLEGGGRDSINIRIDSNNKIYWELENDIFDIGRPKRHGSAG